MRFSSEFPYGICESCLEVKSLITFKYCSRCWKKIKSSTKLIEKVKEIKRRIKPRLEWLRLKRKKD